MSEDAILGVLVGIIIGLFLESALRLRSMPMSDLLFFAVVGLIAWAICGRAGRGSQSKMRGGE